MVDGHGRLVDPPSRSTMWRLGFKSEPNYNDNQLFCGGFSVQWNQNNGECGICGDNIKDSPRDNEAPQGKYAKGIIVKKYNVGETIEVKVQITANHKGWFEYRLCQNDDPKAVLTHACFNKTLLSDAETGETRFTITTSMFNVMHKLKLPSGMRCRNCVLQWKYNTGNSWGVDAVTKEGCIGCGPQEQFYGCADIAIGHDDVIVGNSDLPVTLPKGDVDVKEAMANADTYSANGQCNCTCTSSAPAPSGFSFELLMFVFISVMKYFV